jgi:hypothetical protein
MKANKTRRKAYRAPMRPTTTTTTAAAATRSPLSGLGLPNTNTQRSLLALRSPRFQVR